MSDDTIHIPDVQEGKMRCGATGDMSTKGNWSYIFSDVTCVECLENAAIGHLNPSFIRERIDVLKGTLVDKECPICGSGTLAPPHDDTPVCDDCITRDNVVALLNDHKKTIGILNVLMEKMAEIDLAVDSDKFSSAICNARGRLCNIFIGFKVDQKDGPTGVGAGV